MGIASHLHFISSFWVFSSVVGIFWNCHRKGAFVSLHTTPSPCSPSAADHSGAKIRGAFVQHPSRTHQEDFQIQSCQDAADSVGAAEPQHKHSCLVSPLWTLNKAFSVAPTQFPGCPVVIWHRLSPQRLLAALGKQTVQCLNTWEFILFCRFPCVLSAPLYMFALW